MGAIARIVGVLVGVTTAGCATIVEKQTLVTGPTSRRVVELGLEAPETERVAIELVGSRVLASPIHPGRCVRRVTTTTESTSLVSRSFSSPALAWTPPVLALAVGLWGLASGVRLLPALLPESGPRGDVRPFELGLGIAGASTALIWSIVNIARASNGRDPAKPTIETEDEDYACEVTPRASTRVELLVHGGPVMSEVTGITGSVELSEAMQVRLSSDLDEAAGSVDGQHAMLRWSEPALYFVGSRTVKGQLAYLRRQPNGAHAAVLKRQSADRVLTEVTAEISAALERKDTPAVVLANRRLSALPFDDVTSQARLAVLRERVESYLRAEAGRARAEATKAVLEAANGALQRRDGKTAAALLTRLDELLADEDPVEPGGAKTRRALQDLLKAELVKAQKQVAVALQKRRFDEADALAERVSELGGDGDAVRSRFVDARDLAAVANWRGFLGRCTRVAADLQAIERMYSCDGNCQVIRRRIIAAQEVLQSQVPSLPDGEAPRQQITELCERSTCGLCP